MDVDVVAFVLGAIVSLATSFVLISRLERLGERLGFSEALLGVVAALAADAPEITSAVSALVHGQRVVGAGVVLGSNVFNFASLLGLGALVAGGIVLHRRVVVLAGVVSIWIATSALLAVLGTIRPALALVLALVAMVPYVVVLATRGLGANRIGLPSRWGRWVRQAVLDEEQELYPAIHPARGGPRDALTGVVALAVVVGASVIMERAGSALGGHYSVPGIVVGGIILAVVTSLPNAVAAVLSGRKKQGGCGSEHGAEQQRAQHPAGAARPGRLSRHGKTSPRRNLDRGMGPGADGLHARVGLCGARAQPPLRVGTCDLLRGLRGRGGRPLSLGGRPHFGRDRSGAVSPGTSSGGGSG